MSTGIRSKEDVDFHSDYGHVGRPAVNVKVNLPYGEQWEELARKVGSDIDPEQAEAFVRYVKEHEDDDELWGGVDGLFDLACQDGWENLQTDAEEIFGPGAKVFSEGRSGGWAVVEGIADFEDWDGTMLAKWRKFAKWAREQADGVPYGMLSILFLNRFTAEVLNPAAAATLTKGTCVYCGGPAV